MRVFQLVLVVVFASLLAGCGGKSCDSTLPAGGGGTPTITFTHVPPIGSGNALEGTVTGVAPCDYDVVVFIYVESAWWVKPYANAQLTPISCGSGEWSANIVTGGDDKDATKIIAFVVPSSDTNPWSALVAGPPVTLPGAVASTSVTRTP